MIQCQILNKIIADNDTSILVLNNLDKSFFSDYQNEFLFIKNHLDEYGNAPDQATFLAKFPNFDILEVKESNKYLTEELFKDKRMRSLVKTFNSVKSLLQERKVDEAMALYLRAAEDMTDSMHMECVDIISDTEARFDSFIEKSNDFSKHYIRTGFRELDDVIGGWDRNEELATIIARPNIGKCLEKGTKVLMADGSTKYIEDINVGDKVQSECAINTVLATHNGKAKGYKIIPKIGDPFVVSANHIMTMMKRNHVLRKDDILHTTDGTFALVDMTIEDYMKLTPNQQMMYLLYRPSVTYNQKTLSIDPYILGSWLGDGTSVRLNITTIDPEIKDYWEQYAYSLGLNFTTLSTKQQTRAKTYSIARFKGSSQKNSLLEAFRSYNLIGNKHIPIDYLTASREQRLALLAGILDTDGYLSDKECGTFSITLKLKNLIEEIAQLARGLGFRVGKIKEIERNLPKKGLTRYYHINISGDLTQIPSKLDRKKSIRNDSDRKLSLTNFNVEEIPEIEYYGFECDGDHRFLLWDNTLVHNSWILLKIAIAAAEQGLTVGLYSGEMSEKKVGYRMDSLISHISNTKIIHGNRDIQNDYKQFLDSLKDKIPGKIKVITPAMIGGTAGVTALRAFIEKEKLDILCIDQHSLLEDDKHSKNPVERAANISWDLKKLQVMKKIPIIAVSQANRAIGENGELGLENIAQSDRIGQDSTVVIGLSRKETVLSLHLLKSRDSVNNKTLKYAIDLDKGIFEFVPFEDDAKSGSDCQQLANKYGDYDSGGDEF